MQTQTKGWAVVTGASSGFGVLFAKALAQQGYCVLAVARRLDRLQALAQEAARSGGRVEALAADLQTPEGLQAVVSRAAELGPVEMLVNNAGFADWGKFAELPLAREMDSIQLNVVATVTLTRQFLPGMVARGRGGIINMASLQAFFPVPFLASYAAAKAFVLSFTESIATELKGSGVRVTVVCPGPAKTEFESVSTAHNFQKSIPNLEPGAVVAAALEANRRGRVVAVVGPVNNLLSFAPRILPRTAMRSLMASFSRPK